MVQLSHPYVTTRKIIALGIWTFVGKVMPLLLICYLGLHRFPSKELPSFNFMAAVTVHSDFGVQENKSVTVSVVSLYICLEVMGQSFLNPHHNQLSIEDIISHLRNKPYEKSHLENIHPKAPGFCGQAL